MTSYIFKRILTIIPVALGLITVIFILLYLLPGDTARLIAGQSATPEVVEKIRVEMGFDRPLYQQYFSYLQDILEGDLGRSYRSRRTVVSELQQVVPRTFQLALTAELFSVFIGVSLGLIAASRKDGLIDRFITFISALQLSFPLFWLALMLQISISVVLHLLPPSGYQSGFDRFIILPAITLAIPSSGILARFTRTAVIDVMGEDYIRTAYGKGASKRIVLSRHGVRNALIPVATSVGLDFTRLLGGITIIEVIFSWPGLGKYAFDALVYKDLPALQGAVIVFAISVSLINLLVDIFYGILDPRIRYT